MGGSSQFSLKKKELENRPKNSPTLALVWGGVEYCITMCILFVSETERSGDEQSMFTDSRLLLSSPERQPYKHTQIQVYNRYYNSDYTPYYQYCILHIPTWGSISHVNGSHVYLCHITCHTSIDRNSYYK